MELRSPNFRLLDIVVDYYVAGDEDLLFPAHGRRRVLDSSETTTLVVLRYNHGRQVFSVRLSLETMKNKRDNVGLLSTLQKNVKVEGPVNRAIT